MILEFVNIKYTENKQFFLSTLMEC